MKTLLAAIVFLFCLPTVSMADTAKLYDAEAGVIMAHGVIFNDKCQENETSYDCKLLVRLTASEAAKAYSMMNTALDFDILDGVWVCMTTLNYITTNVAQACYKAY